MSWKIPGRIAWAAAAIAAVVALLLVVVHSPPAVSRVGTWVRAKVASAWHLDLQFSRLSYNAFTRRVSLEDVRLSAPGHAEDPFFTAKRVSADLPWIIFRGRLRVSSLVVDDGRVLLVRENGAMVNLPPSSGNPPPLVPRRFDLRGLTTRGLDVDYVDRTGDAAVSVRDIALALAETTVGGGVTASGPLGAAGLTVRIGSRSTTTTGALRGTLTFDGSHVTVEHLTAPFRELAAVVDGRVTRVLDDATFDLGLQGTSDLAAIAEWTPPLVPVSGAGTFTGRLTGPLATYALGAEFATPDATIGHLTHAPLSGTLHVASPGARVAPFRVEMPGARRGAERPGLVTGTFDYPFGANGRLAVKAEWHDVDLDAALAAYQREPVSASAWQDGTATITRASSEAPLALQASGRSSPLERANRIAVAGTWDATLAGEQWLVHHDHRLLETVRASGSLAWHAPADGAAAPLSGPIALEIADVGPAVRGARRSGIGVSASLEGVHGPAQGTLEVGGTTDHPVVTGRVEATQLVTPTGEAASATADVVYDADALKATRFDLASQGVRLGGDVTMLSPSGRLSGAFSATLDSLPAFVKPWVPAAEADWWSGTASASGTFEGTTDVPRVPFTIQTTDVRRGSQPIGIGRADGRLEGTTVFVTQARVDQGDGHAEGRGQLDYVSGAYTATLTGRGLHVDRPLPDMAIDTVAVDVDFEGSGTLSALGGSGTVTATPSGGRIAELIGPGEVRFRLDGAEVDTRVVLPTLRALVDATVQTAAPYAVRGTAIVDRMSVEPVAIATGAVPDTVTGTMSFSAAFQGQGADAPSYRSQVNLQAIAMQVGGLPVSLDRPSLLAVSPSDFSVDDLAVHAGEAQLVATGHLKDPESRPLRASLTGPANDILTLARAVGLPADVAATGEVSATWESLGGLDRATARASLTGGTVTRDGLPPFQDVTFAAGFDGRTVTIENLHTVWQGGQIDGKGTLPRALLEGTGTPAERRGHVDVTAKGLTQEALRPWVSSQIVQGLDARVSATLALDVTAPAIGGLTGTLRLDEATVTAAGVPIRQERQGRMSIANGVLTFDDVAFSAGEPVVIGGTVAFGETPANPALNLTLTGTPGLRPFSVLSPSLAVDGVATLDLKVTGTVERPSLTGTVALDDAEAVLREPRVIASDVTGQLIFAGDQVRIPELKGSLNGGALDASGRVELDGFTVRGGEITMQAQGVAVEYPQNVVSEIDALLVFDPGPGAPILKGDVRVLRGAYRATISLPALLAFNQRPALPAVPGYRDRVRLDLSVSTVDDLVIDNNYGRMEAGADLRLQGTVARPGATGRVDLREGGEIFVLGGLYRLNASSVSFTNPAAIEPDLNISAITRSAGHEDTVTLSGTLDRLSTDVTSTDPDAHRNVLDVLLGGNSLSREDALALVSGELLGVTGRRLGLDSLRVERGFDVDDIRQDPGLIAEDIDPSTRLTLSKRLRSDVEVILSQDLQRSGGLSAVISYRPWRNIELRGTQRDNTDRAYALRHELSFGGARQPAETRRELPEVATVDLEGAPAPDEPALRRELKVREGKRFDFVRWREDIERLGAWYHTRGFLQARIRASRNEQPDGRLALLYRVTPGPHTEIVVEGTPVSSKLRQTLERAWSDAVFDRFLIDELRWRVQVDLVQRDIIGAFVDAKFDQTDASRRVARITVKDGRQASSRTVRYEGVKAVPTADIDTRVELLGLSEYVWMEPLAIVQPASAIYYEQGYRHAVVNAGQVQFEGDRAILPVTVEEGPATTIAAVDLRGVTDADRPRVLDAVKLDVAQPYRDVAIEDARRRIEADYRSRGYNAVVVTPIASPEADDNTVSVAFAVEPGPDQRLVDVVVQGITRTHSSAVTRALGLKNGAPVDYAAWAQARKRLYDLNVFRQVELRPEVVADASTAESEAVRARVTVAEWPTWRFRYGLQVDDVGVADNTTDASRGRTQSLGVTGDLQNRNVFGRAFTFGLYGRVERRLWASSTYLTFPTFFSRAIQTNVYGSGLRQDVITEGAPTTLRTRQTLSIEQRIRRLRRFELVYGYRLSHERIALVDPDPDEQFLQETTIGRLTASTLVDRRDDPFNAHRGWFGSLAIERISELESNDEAMKLFGTFYRYQPLGSLTLASAIRVGTSFLGDLPPLERFNAGGADTVRGYAENGIGPRTVLGLSAGGDALIILNQEVRAPLYKTLRSVLFVDAGNVFARARDLSFSGLQFGYGVGLRWDTPFSILRLDFGVPSKGHGRRLYFGIGQVF